jgi:protein-disulfide isomerase/uncharacterized membrane protein
MSKGRVDILKIFLVLLVAAAGVALAGLSSVHFIEFKYNLKIGDSFCNINAAFNCDAVTSSKWSTLFGLPLSGYGLGFYLSVVILALATFARVMASRTLFDLVFALSIPAFFFSVYLFIISEFVIGTLCLVCIGMYAVNILLLAASWFFGRDINAGERIASLPRKLRSLFLKTGSQQQSPALAVPLLAGALGVAMIGSFVVPETLIKTLLQERNARVLESALPEQVRRWKTNPPVTFNYGMSSGVSNDYAKGSPDAPIRIVEFSDLECPACKKFSAIVDQLWEQYPGKIYVNFKNYPLDDACNPTVAKRFHPNACFAANLARCAGEQGKFWETIDFIFSLERSDGPPEVRRQEMMEAIELLSMDRAAVEECLTSNRQLMKVRADIEEGDRLKVHGTPSVWINEKRLERPDQQSLQTIIDQILKEHQ